MEKITRQNVESHEEGNEDEQGKMRKVILGKEKTVIMKIKIL